MAKSLKGKDSVARRPPAEPPAGASAGSRAAPAPLPAAVLGALGHLRWPDAAAGGAAKLVTLAHTIWASGAPCGSGPYSRRQRG